MPVFLTNEKSGPVFREAIDLMTIERVKPLFEQAGY